MCASFWRFITFRLSDIDDTGGAGITVVQQSQGNSKYFMWVLCTTVQADKCERRYATIASVSLCETGGWTCFSLCIYYWDCTEHCIHWCPVYKEQYASSLQKQCGLDNPMLSRALRLRYNLSALFRDTSAWPLTWYSASKQFLFLAYWGISLNKVSSNKGVNRVKYGAVSSLHWVQFQFSLWKDPDLLIWFPNYEACHVVKRSQHHVLFDMVCIYFFGFAACCGSGCKSDRKQERGICVM